MTDMTSQEILDAIDRAMKKVAKTFANASEADFSAKGPENEVSKAPTPVIVAAE